MTRDYNGCIGKVRLTSFTRAKQVARRQSQRHHEKFSAYACEVCGGFHVGSNRGDHDNVIKGRIGEHLRYAVFASEGAKRDVLFGWSNKPDGGDVAEVINKKPGWRVTRVVERKVRRAA